MIGITSPRYVAEGEHIAAHAAIHAQDSCEVGLFVAGRYAYSVSVAP